MNTDDPIDEWDRTSALEPGDACDACPDKQDNGDNCNSDSEVLTWGLRPFLREDDVLGDDPTNPTPKPVVGLNEARYRGDSCDPAACMDLAKKNLELDPGKYGKPNPLGAVCAAAPLLGGKCAFTASARIVRDGRVDALLDGVKGSTGHRFCRCEAPRTTQPDRIANCIINGPQCPRTAATFVTAGVSKSMSASPAFTAIPQVLPAEVGTVNDIFTAAPKSSPATYDWLFEQDLLAITGQPPPSLPLTDATAAGIALDGLLASNVRVFPFFGINPDRKDRAFHWMPMALRVQTSIVDVQPLPDAVIYPGWWMVPCKFVPDCVFGFSKPWLLIPPPLSTNPVWGATADVTSDVTPTIDPAALPLLEGAVASPTRVLVPAAEHEPVLSARGGTLAPRAALVDLASRVFLGALAQADDGRLLPVRGRLDAGEALSMQYCTEPAGVACTLPASSSLPRTVATLSAVRRRLFLLTEPAGADGPRLLSFDLLSEQWSEIALSGSSTTELPLAITYHAQADSLFALSRAKQAGGLVRLLRIHLDGRVEAIGQGMGYTQNASAFLTAAENGDLLISISPEQAKAPFRIGRVRAIGSSAKVLGIYHGKGKLVAAPFLTDRALNLATTGADGVRFSELPPAAFDPPSGVDLGSLWK